MSTIITDAVRGEIAAFCRAFAERYMLQPPEFTDPRYALGPYADLYERDLRDVTHPLRSSWYPQMMSSATAADLDALVAAFDRTDSYANTFRIFLMGRLTNAAYRAFKAGLEVSTAFPDWLRAAGWDIPADWVSAPPPLERRHEGCGMHDGLYDAAGTRVLGRSTTSGGIPPTCTCSAVAGTPPGSPSAGPPWRTGTCGESGPFIGLSYPYSIALVKRMAADPDGRANAFRLCAEVTATPEPDVLRDFTVQEIIDGMAGSYGWSRTRTLGWLSRGAGHEPALPPPAGEE